MQPPGSFSLEDNDSLLQAVTLRSNPEPDVVELLERIFEVVSRKEAVFLANYGHVKTAFPYDSQMTPAWRLLQLSLPGTWDCRDEARILRDQKIMRLLLENGAQIYMVNGRHYNWDDPLPPGTPVDVWHDPGGVVPSQKLPGTIDVILSI